MILPALIAVPVLGGLLAWFVEGGKPDRCRLVSLAALGAQLALGVFLALGSGAGEGRWLADFQTPWIPRFGISFHLAADGLSLLLILLTSVLGLLAVVASWTEIKEKIGFFHFNLLWTLAGVTGVFLAMDLFLFYFFWELMLVPMYFLIAIWGHEHRVYAAIKFFIFTQAGGLVMLVAILALVSLHLTSSGEYTFSYSALFHTPMDRSVSLWLMLGFFVAFAVKLPAVPLHTWLPDAHTQAPTGGSIILAGLLLKTGAYGLIRFVVPLFPQASREFAPVAMALGAAGVLYGALLAFAQQDLKRMIAYTSVSHLGFVLLGVFAHNELAMQGAIMQMVCHGLSAGGLFFIAGALQERFHSRDMDRFGGLWKGLPRMGGTALFFAMASLGLPGLGNFVGEILVLFGSFTENVWLTAVATTGLIVATIYSLMLLQRVFYGRLEQDFPAYDLRLRDMVALGVVMILLVYLGVLPQPVFDTAETAVTALKISWGG